MPDEQTCALVPRFELGQQFFQARARGVVVAAVAESRLFAARARGRASRCLRRGRWWQCRWASTTSSPLSSSVPAELKSAIPDLTIASRIPEQSVYIQGVSSNTYGLLLSLFPGSMRGCRQRNPLVEVPVQISENLRSMRNSGKNAVWGHHWHSCTRSANFFRNPSCRLKIIHLFGERRVRPGCVPDFVSRKNQRFLGLRRRACKRGKTRGVQGDWACAVTSSGR